MIFRASTERGGYSRSLDIDLAYALLLSNNFYLIANLITQSDFAGDCVDQHKWSRCVLGVELDVFYASQPIKERLSRLDIFDPVEFERVGGFAEYALRDLDPFAR